MSARTGQYRWKVLLPLLFLISMVNFGDRAALGAVVPLLVQEYHFTPTVLGWILSAFGFGYCAMQLLGSGTMVRWLQPHKLISGMSILWSVFVGLTVLAATPASFIALRALFGVAEGSNWMSFESLVSRWFGRFELQRAVNIYWSGIPLSAILVPPLAVVLAGALTWRGPFLVLGVLGVLLGVVFFYLVTDFPEDSPRVAPGECSFILANRPLRDQHRAHCYRWKTVFTSIPGWCAAVASFTTAYQTYMLIAWLPEYLVHERHFPFKTSGLMTAIPFIAAGAGIVSAAMLSDAMHRRGRVFVSRTAIPGLLTAVAGAAFVMIAEVQSIGAVMTLLVVAAFCAQGANGVLAATAIDIFPYEPHMGAQLIVGFGSLAAIVAPVVTGYIVSATHSFLDAFLVGGGTPLIVGVLFLLVFRVRSEVPDRVIVDEPISETAMV